MPGLQGFQESYGNFIGILMNNKNFLEKNRILKMLLIVLVCMGINIAESAVSVVLTWILVPRFAVGGFLCVIYFNEIFNFVLSFRKLQSVIKSNCQTASQQV